MGRDVGSQAVAVRIERLYVLTWLSAWCGVFLVLAVFSLTPDIYIILSHLRSTVHLESLHYWELPYELQCNILQSLSSRAPLLPYESSKSGHIRPIP